MKTRIRGLIRQCETGFDVTFTAIGYILILFLLLAMVFEFGRLTYVSSVSYNAARAAVQEAVKQVDVNSFLSSQEINLDSQFNAVVAETYGDLTNGVIPPPSEPLFIEYNDLHDGQKMLGVRVRTLVSMPMLDQLSFSPFPPVLLTVQAYAEPSYGINKETQ